jgi:hypothetical protein
MTPDLEERLLKLLPTCSDPLPTSRDKTQCHLCCKPVREHPTDGDRVYWAAWTVFHTLTELSYGPH